MLRIKYPVGDQVKKSTFSDGWIARGAKMYGKFFSPLIYIRSAIFRINYKGKVVRNCEIIMSQQ
ncbi:MAG: hypothetical protein D3925_02170 [Candidatus Electrothrix sp. AR5]|nr:hypothetical protein [Candidatus Electrothrix sp. AR5]